jgi:hypothetical protein
MNGAFYSCILVIQGCVSLFDVFENNCKFGEKMFTSTNLGAKFVKNGIISQ